mmetsp:Transcript_69783/g.110719  ORF Transcript_69783/g.110719 Transcript_69783/m.110719 type:complete len:158 (-) Transcript_69783:53-526(-)
MMLILSLVLFVLSCVHSVRSVRLSKVKIAHALVDHSSPRSQSRHISEITLKENKSEGRWGSTDDSNNTNETSDDPNNDTKLDHEDDEIEERDKIKWSRWFVFSIFSLCLVMVLMVIGGPIIYRWFLGRPLRESMTHEQTMKDDSVRKFVPERSMPAS